MPVSGGAAAGAGALAFVVDGPSGAGDRMGRAQGVYSHSTALELYATPEMKPPNLHPELEMTVPKGFRRSGATPEVAQLQLEALLGWKKR